MSVTIRPYRGGPRVEVDVRVELEDGTVKRVRRRFKNGNSEARARKWGERVERAVLMGAWKTRSKPVKRVPTLAEFVPFYLDVYCSGLRHKPSFIASKRIFLKNHIIPAIGDKRLNEITEADVLAVQQRLKHMVPGSANNHLATLSSLLKAAVKKREIDRVPCTIELIKVQKKRFVECYSFDEYERLLGAAARLCPEVLVAMLLGGDAGLRRGEVVALKWSDIDRASAVPSVTVRRTAWGDADYTPKSGNERRIPLTSRVASALETLVQQVRDTLLRAQFPDTLVPLEDVRLADRYLFKGRTRARRVPSTVCNWMAQAQALAGLRITGRFHVLRHTFCSHLAARGVPAVDIKELAGHASIRTTEKYMHNLPGSAERGIAMLERPVLRKGAEQSSEDPGSTNSDVGRE
jgi:integrase